jgi:hypothetical protein
MHFLRQYLQRVEEFEERAKAATTEESRKELLRHAASWRKAAELRKRVLGITDEDSETADGRSSAR